MRPLRRRDVLAFGVLGVGALGLGRLAGRALVGVTAPSIPRDEGRLTWIDARQEALVTAVALAMVGPHAEQDYDAGRWDPAADVDRLLGALAPDQRRMLGLTLYAFEEATWSLSGFSGLPRERQVAILASWRTSRLAAARTVWGFLHAATVTSYSGGPAGWARMGYPGPCLPSDTTPGRPPGQRVAFEWDEVVP